MRPVLSNINMTIIRRWQNNRPLEQAGSQYLIFSQLWCFWVLTPKKRLQKHTWHKRAKLHSDYSFWLKSKGHNFLNSLTAKSLFSDCFRCHSFRTRRWVVSAVSQYCLPLLAWVGDVESQKISCEGSVSPGESPLAKPEYRLQPRCRGLWRSVHRVTESNELKIFSVNLVMLLT